MKTPTVVGAARSIRSGALTSEALVLERIDRIERHNPALNAFVHLDLDAALAAARSVDRTVKAGGAGLGPLAGVPFGVKDLEHCAGMPGRGGMSVIHGMLANLVNLPAISLPAGFASDGLPVGLQIVGPRHRKDLLLAVARRYEAQPWTRHSPLAG